MLEAAPRALSAYKPSQLAFAVAEVSRDAAGVVAVVARAPQVP